MQVECIYKIEDGDIPLLEGCAARAVIDEHIEAISSAFNKIKITIDVDDEWGFCKIIAVNGSPVMD